LDRRPAQLTLQQRAIEPNDLGAAAKRGDECARLLAKFVASLRCSAKAQRGREDEQPAEDAGKSDDHQASPVIGEARMAPFV
jgi:hypothetical protein